MVSFLIVSKDKNLRETQALDICSENKIDPVDILIVDKDTNVKKTKARPALSIGIEDVKYLQEQIFLKPIKSKEKACVIKDAQLMTLQAQNAMLKTLEEPPKHTLIFLTASSLDALLPTIQSRCKIIDLQSINVIADNEKQQLTDLLLSLSSVSPADALAMAEKLAKEKEGAALWLEKAIFASRELMLSAVGKGSEEEKTRYLTAIRKLEKTYNTLNTTNINPRMTLENLFLSFSNNP